MNSTNNEGVAGIDVHKAMLAVVVARAGQNETEYVTRKFGAGRWQLKELIDWLLELGVGRVAMESTAPVLEASMVCAATFLRAHIGAAPVHGRRGGGRWTSRMRMNRPAAARARSDDQLRARSGTAPLAITHTGANGGYAADYGRKLTVDPKKFDLAPEGANVVHYRIDLSGHRAIEQVVRSRVLNPLVGPLHHKLKRVDQVRGPIDGNAATNFELGPRGVVGRPLASAAASLLSLRPTAL